MTHADRVAMINKLIAFAKKHKKENAGTIRAMLSAKCRSEGMSANTVRDYVTTVMSRL